MLGYIKPDAPGMIVPPQDGWYNTGDVVAHRRRRLHRHPRPASSASPRSAARPCRWRWWRYCAAALWPDNRHAAVAVPDGRKGEQIVLVTDLPRRSRLDLVAWAQNHGVSELAVPRRIVVVRRTFRCWAPARPTMSRVAENGEADAVPAA